MMNRSPLPPIAQTPLQLYRQLANRGIDDTDARRVRDACLIGARFGARLLRGSGKPFSCHLIGVASLVAECDRAAIDHVVAGLLHALLQDRLVVAPDRGARYAALRTFSGDAVAALVDAFDRAGPLEPDVPKAEPGNAEERMVRLMQLADELDDAADGGPHWHGDADNGARPGSAADQRLKRFLALGPAFERASAYGGARLAARWQQLQGELTSGVWPAGFRSGHDGSFVIDG